jgi:AsmA family protein
MSIIVWLILGLVAGFIGSKIVNKSGEGVVLDIVLGIVGAVVGGFLFSMVGASPVTGFNIYSIFVAVIGAIVALGRHITVTVDDVVIANPPGWPEGDPPLARAQHLTIETALLRYLRGDGLVLPLIAVDHPVVYAAEQPDDTANFKISTGSGGTTPKIGKLEITDGTARVVIPKLKANFTANIATRNPQGASDEGAQIVADAKGTYADQPIEAHMIGGALLSLRDKKTPWPIDLALANGPTKLSLNGTLQDPVALAGANLTLQASGPDMGLLQSLTGFPIPKTLPYQIATQVDLKGLDRVRLTDLRGHMGESDIEGSLEVEPEAQAEPARRQSRWRRLTCVRGG